MKKLILFCFLISITPFPIFAQRGSDYTQQNPSTTTPLSSFPGYFDTGMAPVKRLLFDIPAMQIDYGLNENLTIGTNGITTLYSTFFFQPALFLKARYRFYSTQKVSSVITGYFGYLNYTEKNNTSNHTWLYNGTNNTSLFFDSNNVLNFHATALSFHSQTGNPSDTKYFKLTAQTLALGVGYQRFFSEKFSMEGLIIVPAYLKIEFEDPNSLSSIAFNDATTTFPLFLRVLLNWKTGPESVLSGGYWSFGSILSGPWLGWTVIL